MAQTNREKEHIFRNMYEIKTRTHRRKEQVLPCRPNGMILSEGVTLRIRQTLRRFTVVGNMQRGMLANKEWFPVYERRNN